VLCQHVRDAGELLNLVLARFDPTMQVQPQDAAAWSAVTGKLLKGKDALIVLDNIESDERIAPAVQLLREAGVTLLLTASQQLSDDVIPSDATQRLGLLAPEEALSLFAQKYGRTGSEVLSAKEHSAAERIVKALGWHTFAVR